MNFKIPENIIKFFLSDNFGDVKETSTGELRINTPFADDRKFHMYINPEKGVVHDFKTGYGSDFVGFVSEYLQISRNNVVSHLVKNYSGRQDGFSVMDYVEKSTDLILPDKLWWFSSGKGVMRKRAFNYLKNRGIPGNVINQLGYIFDPWNESEYDKTIFIPFYENGVLVYFSCRDFTNKNPKRYINPHDVNSKKFVYNIDNIEDTVFIFEGVLDALMLEKQVGTAMLSADLGKEQAIKIHDKAPKNVIFVPDNDETGKSTLEKNINLFLKYKPPSSNIDLMVYEIRGDAKDFGETGKHHISLNECRKWNKWRIGVEKLWHKEQ